MAVVASKGFLNELWDAMLLEIIEFWVLLESSSWEFGAVTNAVGFDLGGSTIGFLKAGVFLAKV